MIFYNSQTQKLLLFIINSSLNFIMTNNPERSANQSRVTIKHLEADIHSIQMNQLNNSSSKMQYSFPKSDRFNNKETSVSPPKFYDLPDIKSKRSTTLGYGNKIDLSHRYFVTPGANNYNIKSQFDLKSKEGVTMSAGRQVIKTNNVFSSMDIKTPGPNNYSPKIYNPSYKYSIREKIEDKSNKWINCVPGPGNYSHLQLINKQTRSPISKYGSCASTKFGKNQRKPLGEEKLKVPGVGEYNIDKEAINTSKFYLLGGSRFGRGQRKGLDDKTLQTPGPGAYNKFSEFLH